MALLFVGKLLPFFSSIERKNQFKIVSLPLQNMGCKKLDISKNYESVLTVVGKYPTIENLRVGNFLATKKGCVNYFPFGSVQPGRSFNSTEYRFGFNGKENDNEVMGAGNFQDYGFRMYNSRLGRFISVDPLKDKFPMLSTYQFAGNMPIMYIDLDGLEPANNPKSPGTKEKVGMAVVSGIATGASAHNAIENPSTLNPFAEKETLKGEGLCKGNNDYVTDTKGDPTNQFNMYVSNGSTFKVDESNANQFNNYEAFVVNTLMQNMVSGTGAENYDFPTNGIISSKFLQSDILKSAVADFNSGNKVESKQYAFGAKELYNDTKRNGTLFNITGLTGSGMITIVPNKDGIQVKIFNITSLTSGTFGKEALDKSKWPKSYARDPEKTTPYGNISQTFNLFIPYKK
jgi:RHS repeat-associated protein